MRRNWRLQIITVAAVMTNKILIIIAIKISYDYRMCTKECKTRHAERKFSHANAAIKRVPHVHRKEFIWRIRYGNVIRHNNECV